MNGQQGLQELAFTGSRRKVWYESLALSVLVKGRTELMKSHDRRLEGEIPVIRQGKRVMSRRLGA